MKLGQYKLYKGPLDGLVVHLDYGRPLDLGDEAEFNIDHTTRVTAAESSLDSNAVLSSPSQRTAVYEFDGVELVYLRTKVTKKV